MTDNPRMVDLPWVDGTTRTVPEWTVYVDRDGYLVYARDGGYSIHSGAGSYINPHVDHSVAVSILIFAEAPEPPVKVNVPTGLGAIVSSTAFPNDPCYVLTRYGWLGLHTGIKYDPSEIANLLRAGARVIFEGVDEETQ